jgi:hypothetical protein
MSPGSALACYPDGVESGNLDRAQKIEFLDLRIVRGVDQTGQKIRQTRLRNNTMPHSAQFAAAISLLELATRPLSDIFNRIPGDIDLIEIYADLPADKVITERISTSCGWIRSSRPISTLDVLTNGVRQELVQVHPRPDVEAIYPECCVLGWSCFFETASLMSVEQKALTIEIIVNGEIRGKYFFRCKISDFEAGLDTHVVYFMHIPKTAGSSMRLALEQDAAHLKMLRIYPAYPFITREQVGGFSKRAFNDLDIIYGHFTYGIHELSSRPFRYISLVREPEALIRSYYFFAKYIAEAPEYVECKSIFEAMNKIQDIVFDNYMVRYFTGNFREDKISMRDFYRAVANIERDFQYVGVVEDMGKTLDRIGSYLGVRLEQRFDNVTTKTEEQSNLDMDALKRHLASSCEFDQLLYEFILSLA